MKSTQTNIPFKQKAHQIKEAWCSKYAFTMTVIFMGTAYLNLSGLTVFSFSCHLEKPDQILLCVAVSDSDF